MSRRKKNETPFSLFAFQDIITSVTGIMILITLILALELLATIENSPTHQTQEVIAQIESTATEVASLDQAVARNMKRIEELKVKLAQGASEIGEVAGFIRTSAQADLSDMQQIDAQLANQLEALAAKIQDSSEQREQINDQLQNLDMDELQGLGDRISQREKDLEALRNRIIFNPSAGDGKTPWLVEVSAENIVVAQTGVSAPPTNLPSVAAFRTWARQRDKTRDYFVLLVRPDGIDRFHSLQDAIGRMGFEIGYDLLDQNTIAIDAERGAAAQ